MPQNITITQPTQDDIDLVNNTEIQFVSSIPLINSALFVQSPDGMIYDIHSQSISTIHIGTGGLVVETTGIIYTGNLSQSVEEQKLKLQKQFDTEKVVYLQNMVKNKARNNVYVQYI